MLMSGDMFWSLILESLPLTVLPQLNDNLSEPNTLIIKMGADKYSQSR